MTDSQDLPSQLSIELAPIQQHVLQFYQPYLTVTSTLDSCLDFLEVAALSTHGVGGAMILPHQSKKFSSLAWYFDRSLEQGQDLYVPLQYHYRDTHPTRPDMLGRSQALHCEQADFHYQIRESMCQIGTYGLQDITTVWFYIPDFRPTGELPKVDPVWVDKDGDYHFGERPPPGPLIHDAPWRACPQEKANSSFKEGSEDISK